MSRVRTPPIAPNFGTKHVRNGIAVTLILKHQKHGYFVDGSEPIDWTWGTENEATRYKDRAALEARFSKTPFEYGGMISQGSILVIEINNEPTTESDMDNET
jgi:hypothetical protein